ncbi:MAG: phospholipase D family protein [Burkholderiaceae bacterium]
MPPCKPTRRLAGALAGMMVAWLAGCAALPQGVQRPVSYALAPAVDTALGRIAQAAAPADPALSGARLLSWPAQALDARIALAQRAERSLDLQYYVLHDDVSGRHLLRALRDAALRGVRVRLLLDDLYTAELDPLLLGLATLPGVEVRLFNPFPAGRSSLGTRLLASALDFGRVNHRMHNKLFVADGVMAIAGGRNIGDEYFLVHEEANYIDLDAFVAGPAVQQLGALFDRYWNSEHVFPLHAIAPPEEPPEELRRVFEARVDAARAPPPPPPPPGATDAAGQRHVSEELAEGRIALHWAPVEVFADDPDKVIDHEPRYGADGTRRRPTVRRGLMNELLLARQEVLLSSPYLVPNPDVMDDIREGRLWGLRIAIITNSLASTDEPLVHAGYRRYRDDMLDLGVELYEIVPSRISRAKNLGAFGHSVGRFHAKAAAVDGKVTFIGSLNLDPRSDKHNTELGILIRSAEVTQQLVNLAELVKTEAAYRLKLNRANGRIEWTLPEAVGGETLTEEPDSTWWQRLLLNVVGPFVPEEHL